MVDEQAPPILAAPVVPQLPKQPKQVQESDNEFQVVSSSTYLGRHSTQAFPRFMGFQKQAQILPKLQPFAWNMGVALQPVLKARKILCSLITLDETKKHVRTFFSQQFPGLQLSQPSRPHITL